MTEYGSRHIIPFYASPVRRKVDHQGRAVSAARLADRGVLVESAAHYEPTGAVQPFDGPNEAAIRDVVIAASRIPIRRVRALDRSTSRRPAVPPYREVRP